MMLYRFFQFFYQISWTKKILFWFIQNTPLFFSQPGETWSPDTCTNCNCSSTINKTSGFHIVMCEHIPCPAFDKEECSKIGGQPVPTVDGCCTLCDNKCVDSENNTFIVRIVVFSEISCNI